MMRSPVVPEGAVYGQSRRARARLAERRLARRRIATGLRFDKLALLLEAGDPRQAISVADLGCGYGAMFHYLDERHRLPVGRYVGYDISEQMLDAASSSTVTILGSCS